MYVPGRHMYVPNRSPGGPRFAGNGNGARGGVQTPQIRAKAERSGLRAVSEAWSAKMGCLGAPRVLANAEAEDALSGGKHGKDNTEQQRERLHDGTALHGLHHAQRQQVAGREGHEQPERQTEHA